MAKFIVNNRTEAWKADVNLMIHSCVCSLNYMKISKWAPGNFSVIVTTKVMTILLGTWISGASVVEYFDTSSFEAGQGSPEFTTLGAFLFKRKQEQYKREHHSVYVRCKTVNTCALYRFFLSQVLLSQVGSLFFFVLFFMTQLVTVLHRKWAHHPRNQGIAEWNLPRVQCTPPFSVSSSEHKVTSSSQF